MLSTRVRKTFKSNLKHYLNRLNAHVTVEHRCFTHAMMINVLAPLLSHTANCVVKTHIFIKLRKLGLWKNLKKNKKLRKFY